MKHPPFVSYDFNLGVIFESAGERFQRKPTLRALAKDGTIWETVEDNNGVWRPWSLLGEATE
jgi:hypothetical protein